jgi:hypothetical protein
MYIPYAIRALISEFTVMSPLPETIQKLAHEEFQSRVANPVARRPVYRIHLVRAGRRYCVLVLTIRTRKGNPRCRVERALDGTVVWDSRTDRWSELTGILTMHGFTSQPLPPWTADHHFSRHRQTAESAICRSSTVPEYIFEETVQSGPAPLEQEEETLLRLDKDVKSIIYDYKLEMEKLDFKNGLSQAYLGYVGRLEEEFEISLDHGYRLLRLGVQAEAAHFIVLQEMFDLDFGNVFECL